MAAQKNFKAIQKNLILRNELKVNLCFHWPCTLSASAFVFLRNFKKKKKKKKIARHFPHFFAFCVQKKNLTK